MIAASLLLMASGAGAATVVFGPGDDQVLQWEQSPDAVTLAGQAYVGQRFVRLSAGGSIATLITPAALENAVYGMTAAFARFSSDSAWTLEVFAGGDLTLSGTPAGATLLISSTGGDPNQSDEDHPVWLARGTGNSGAGPLAAGTVVWGRISAMAGTLGVDSVLGVENISTHWYLGDNPAQTSITNWDFEIDPFQADIPEPSTFALLATGLAVLAFGRTRRQ
jgi:hypothetical protein